MVDSGFYDRRDAAPRVAEGWDFVDGTWVSNIFSYPPIGSPDGGAHVTAPDLLCFIRAVRFVFRSKRAVHWPGSFPALGSYRLTAAT